MANEWIVILSIIAVRTEGYFSVNQSRVTGCQIFSIQCGKNITLKCPVCWRKLDSPNYIDT